MIYQDVYSQIKPVSMFGEFQEAKQARDLEQQRKNTLANQVLANQQRAYEQKQRVAKTLFNSANKFANLPDDQRASSWQSYRSQWVSYLPEANGILPNVWDPKDQANNQQLKVFIEYLSDFVPEETISVAQGAKIIGLKGGQARTIAENPKTEEEYDKLVDIQTVDPKTGQPIEKTVRRRKNEEGFWQSGNLIFPEGYDEGVDKEVYYNKMGIVPKSKSASVGASIQPSRPSVNSLATPPAAPMAVPGQTELPPMQFNAPSSTNRSGETNQAFPIDMSMAAPGQPTNALAAMNIPVGGMSPPVAPQMGAAPVAPPVNAMAVPFAGGMGMALPVDIQQVTQAANMLAQEQDQFMPPNQFAQLRPAGSAPNRFGSPGVEGMEFAATGPVDARGIPLSAIGSARPRYVATDKGPVKEVFRPMTPEEVEAEGQDPAKMSGRISQFGVIQWNPPKQTAAQIRKEGAEVANAEATAAQNLSAVRRARSEVVSFLRGVRMYRSVLNKLGEQQFVDTGPIDALVTQFTDLGSELDGLKQTVGSELQSAMKVAGDPKTKQELDEMVGQLPHTRRRLYQNFKNLNFREEYFLDRLGVQTSVANDAEFDALTPGTTFVDLNDGGIYRKMKAKQ